jgi:hypothetical protein
MTAQSRSQSQQPPSKLTLSELEAFLGASPDETPGVHAYCDSAAVLVAFDVLSLRPVDAPAEPAEGEVLDALLTVCEPAVHATQPGLWSLTLPSRHAALARLGTRARMKSARAVNAGLPDLTLQKMLDRVIDGAAFDVQKLSRDEIAALLTIAEWMDGILADLPDTGRLRHALAHADLLAPLHRLAGTIFVGREAQLQRLATYISSPGPLPPLFVFGTGGVGKSSLLARYVLRDLAPREQPIAYLDIDRPTIQPEKPLTLLVDAITQLAPQVGWTPHDVDPMVKEMTYALRRQEGGRQLESGLSYRWVFDLFGNALMPRLAGRTPVLVVDTIEEAQFLGSEVVDGLMRFFFDLVARVPVIRVVLAGRVLPDEYVDIAKNGPVVTATFQNVDDWMRDEKRPERPINLGVLDDASARELLARELELLGVPPLTDAELTDVIGIVTSNPMCLKLGARVLRDEGVDKLRADRAQFLAKLKVEKIQGLLYGRILRHLHGRDATGHDDVRSVAYPGLVVRRLTPDVIREVLAGPCKLTLTPKHNEQDIFQALSREAALLERDPQDDSLRHRADVRRIMLQDLTDHVDPKLVDQINLMAVEYYQGKTDVPSRAEELYHRMRCLEPPETLEPFWKEDLAPRLRGAIEEISGRQRLWLASKLHVTLDLASRDSADQDAWEEQTARLVDRYLRSRAADKALDALKERPARAPRSRLYALEAEAYRFLGRFDEALAVARKGVDALSAAGATDMALELLLRMAAIEESRGRLPAADHLVDEALGVANHSPNRLLKLRTHVAMLRLQRQLRPNGREERKVLRRGVLDELTDDVRQELRGSPVLLREVAAELGKDDPTLAALAIDTLGIEVANDDQARAFGHAIVQIGETDDTPDMTKIISGAADSFKESEFDPTVIRKWVVEKVTTRDTRRLSQSVNDASNDVLRGFRDYFRAGVQSTLRGDY